MEKRSNIRVIEATEREETENKSETIFKKKPIETFSRLMKDIKLME